MAFSRHTTRKRFGQHWLRDGSILDQILDAADLIETDRVLEIGPGQGALTERLLSTPACSIHTIELDRDLVAGLNHRFGQNNRFSLQQGDALKASLDDPYGRAANKVVANIPYNITGPLLERLLGSLQTPREPAFEKLVLLVQKEVAERILAKPGESNFSAMSVRLQLMAKAQSICRVPPHCFRPPPKVQSEVIALAPFQSDQRIHGALAKEVAELLRHAFSSRRKMLSNSLVQLTPKDELTRIAVEAGVSLKQRPQDLSPNSWINLAKCFMQNNHLSNQE